MAPEKRFSESYILIIEAVIFFAFGIAGRAVLDQAMMNLAWPSWAVIITRIVTFLVFVIVAVLLDRLLHRYLKSRGWVE